MVQLLLLEEQQFHLLYFKYKKSEKMKIFEKIQKTRKKKIKVIAVSDKTSRWCIYTRGLIALLATSRWGNSGSTNTQSSVVLTLGLTIK